MCIARVWSRPASIAMLMALSVCLGGLPRESRATDDQGIFERILEASGSFGEATAAFEGALALSPLALQGKFDLAMNQPGQRARVYLLTDPKYISAAASEMPETASAQLLRVAIYEIGEGRHTHVDMANPLAHAMVFYSGSARYGAMLAAAQGAGEDIRSVASAIPGRPVAVQLEPRRSEAALNDFKGDGMARMMAKWRNWQASQAVLLTDSPERFGAVIGRVESALKASGDRGLDDPSGWRLVAKVPVGANAVVFGVTNAYTESTSIRINSNSRADAKSKDAPYPGVDHAPALPLEILVVNDGKQVRVTQYGEMWRMQLYFWDSGYLAFAQNAGVPGTIFKSIEAVIVGGRADAAPPVQ